MVDKVDNLSTLSSLVKITHLPEGLSLELENLLVQLPRNQVCICPASLASVEILPKLPHLLHSAGPRHDQEVDLGILLDTGCSVATTGFEEDFCEQTSIQTFWSNQDRQWYGGNQGLWHGALGDNGRQWEYGADQSSSLLSSHRQNVPSITPRLHVIS